MGVDKGRLNPPSYTYNPQKVQNNMPLFRVDFDHTRKIIPQNVKIEPSKHIKKYISVNG